MKKEIIMVGDPTNCDVYTITENNPRQKILAEILKDGVDITKISVWERIPIAYRLAVVGSEDGRPPAKKAAELVELPDISKK